MKKVLVTGGAGFIGSHLCSRLLEDGCEVLCLDNLSTGSINNIKYLMNNPAFKFINHDIIQKFDTKVDEIYNLACPASPIDYQQNPIKTMQTSVIGVINLLELAKQYNAKILQMSTSEVYGNPIIHPQSEEYFGNVNPVGVRSCYDEGKRCAESLMCDYHRMNNIDTKIARIFNTYGPKMAQNDGRVVSNFIIQALNNNDITVYGDGTQTRSFCYVNDTVDGIIKLMNADYFMPINIGNSHEISIIELAEKIIKLTNSNSKIVYKSLPQDDPVRRKPDITKANEILNWEPKIDLIKGLEATIEYFKSF